MADITFDPPKGFDPRGAKPGDTFECVARVEIEDDGKYSLVALDGVPLNPDEDEGSEDDKNSQEPSFSDAVNNGQNYPPVS